MFRDYMLLCLGIVCYVLGLYVIVFFGIVCYVRGLYVMPRDYICYYVRGLYFMFRENSYPQIFIIPDSCIIIPKLNGE